MNLDSDLGDLDFVAFDTETTGCRSDSSRMVEIGAVRFRLDGTEVDRFTSLINPLRPIPPAVIRVHGITDAMVRDAPTEAEILPRFLEYLGDPSHTLLMAHNARFDMGFVESALARSGIEPPPHRVIDTVRLSRRRAAGLPSHSLRSLVRTFGIGTTTDHRGLSDSLDLMRVFLALVFRPPAPSTAADLFAFASPYRFRTPAEAAARSAVSARSSWGRRTTMRSGYRRPPTGLAQTGYDAGDVRLRLTNAIAAGRSVSLVYDGGRASGERRSVTPLKVIASVDVTYLLAFCHNDRKRKQYRVDRIVELSVE